MTFRNTKGRQSAFFRGADGMRKTDEELAYQKQRADERKAAGNQPFRFYVPVGETRRIIICDDKPDFFMYEHAMKDAEGRWGRKFSGCVKSFDNCPVCAVSERESYYAMVLTCVDLTPFKTRDGHEVEFSRKLLIVKPAQQKKFLRFFDKEGSLRGAIFDMTRDGDKDSSIGNDIEFVDFADEDEMATYTRSWKDKDGKKHTEICDEPYVYEDLFEEPDVEKLRALVGGSPTPGSRRHDEEAVSGRGRTARPTRGARDSEPARGASRSSRHSKDDWEDADDSLPFEPDERPARRSRAAPELDHDEETPPKTARRGREEPEADEPTTRRPARRGREEPEVDADEPEPEARRPARRGREEPEPEEPVRRPARTPRR